MDGDIWQGWGHVVGCGGMWQGVGACATPCHMPPHPATCPHLCCRLTPYQVHLPLPHTPTPCHMPPHPATTPATCPHSLQHAPNPYHMPPPPHFPIHAIGLTPYHIPLPLPHAPTPCHHSCHIPPHPATCPQPHHMSQSMS